MPLRLSDLLAAVLVAVVVVFVTTTAVVASAQDGAEGEERSEAELREEILELDRRIQALLGELSPEAREAMLRELAAAEAAEGEATAEEVAVADAGSSAPAGAPAEAPAGERVEGAPDEPEIYFEPVVSDLERVAAPDPPRESAARAAVEPPPAEPSAEIADLAAVAPCRPLAALDTNGDGKLSAGDRYWRFLYVTKRGGSGTQTEDSVETLYDAGVRELDWERRTYTNAKREVEDLDWSQHVELARIGQGGGAARLVLDGAALLRGGRLQLLAATGAPIEGLQVLEATQALAGEQGTRPVFCPK